MTDDIDRQIADLRPLLARALHAVCPQLALVDCARLANAALDQATDGEFRNVHALLALLNQVVERQSNS